MKSLNIKKFMFVLATIIPMIILAMSFNRLPNEIPLTFAKGRLNEVGSKYNLFILPIVNLAIAFIMFILGYKSDNEVRNLNYEKLSLSIGTVILLFLDIMFLIDIIITLKRV